MDCFTAAAAANINIRPISSADNRRLRRMISNRESARRSRLRKQRHLEDLRSRVGRLRLDNTAVNQSISVVSGQCVLIRRENELLKSESAALRRRLSEIRQLLFLRQLDCLSSPPTFVSVSSTRFSSANEQIMNSLIA